MAEKEKPPINNTENPDNGGPDNIINLNEVRASRINGPERREDNLESEKNRLEARVLEVCNIIETRARSMSERLQAAYDKIDSPDKEKLRRTAAENHQLFFTTINKDRAAFLEFVSQATSVNDIEQIEQKLEAEMSTGSMANLDDAEAQLQELEKIAESQTANSLTDRFFNSGGIKKPTSDELADMPESVRNEVGHQMERLDQDASSFKIESERKISLLETRYRAVRNKVKGRVSPDTLKQIEESFNFLKKAVETHKSLPENQKRGLEAQEIRVNVDRMLDNLDTLSVRWG